ncbi:LOW QUALITY PROTEIN: hypothetical protein Cgig2_022436 [Carnegiea gigantea]|uniref:Uncharacterized protein n=1 Tax=Carnegiea gigantea TaxID=171969 RepID=A0A9Q1JK55_9CARY|nr:LOW QUALITY PROTEIN: hypothetical protein Cgig2_022436 [Carnegiea gigantea]
MDNMKASYMSMMIQFSLKCNRYLTTDNVTKEAPAQQRETSTEMQAQKSPPHSRHRGAADENVQECISPDDAYYCRPEFLEQLDKLESIAREKIQHRKRVVCSPPSFNLGISLQQEATAAPSAHPTPGTVLGAAASTEQQTDEGSEHAINPEKAPQTNKGINKAAEIHEINKAKQVVKRQQPKRMVT